MERVPPSPIREVELRPPWWCKLILALLSAIIVAFTVIIPILMLSAAPFVIMTGAMALFVLLSCLVKMKCTTTYESTTSRRGRHSSVNDDLHQQQRMTISSHYSPLGYRHTLPSEESHYRTASTNSNRLHSHSAGGSNRLSSSDSSSFQSDHITCGDDNYGSVFQIFTDDESSRMMYADDQRTIARSWRSNRAHHREQQRRISRDRQRYGGSLRLPQHHEESERDISIRESPRASLGEPPGRFTDSPPLYESTVNRIGNHNNQTDADFSETGTNTCVLNRVHSNSSRTRTIDGLNCALMVQSSSIDSLPSYESVISHTNRLNLDNTHNDNQCIQLLSHNNTDDSTIDDETFLNERIINLVTTAPDSNVHFTENVLFMQTIPSNSQAINLTSAHELQHANRLSDPPYSDHRVSNHPQFGSRVSQEIMPDINPETRTAREQSPPPAYETVIHNSNLFQTTV